MAIHDVAIMAGEDAVGFGKFLWCETLQQLHDQGDFHWPFAVLANQFSHRQAHGLGHLTQEHNGNIALARFQLREISLRDPGIPRQNLARHAAPGAGAAHTITQCLEVPLGIPVDGGC